MLSEGPLESTVLLLIAASFIVILPTTRDLGFPLKLLLAHLTELVGQVL